MFWTKVYNIPNPTLLHPLPKPSTLNNVLYNCSGCSTGIVQHDCGLQGCKQQAADAPCVCLSALTFSHCSMKPAQRIWIPINTDTHTHTQHIYEQTCKQSEKHQCSSQQNSFILQLPSNYPTLILQQTLLNAFFPVLPEKTGEDFVCLYVF